MPMKMRQSLTNFERAFEAEMEIDRQRRESLRRTAERRARQRSIERNTRLGRVRFIVLSMTLMGTAVAVSIVMFRLLYLLFE